MVSFEEFGRAKLFASDAWFVYSWKNTLLQRDETGDRSARKTAEYVLRMRLWTFEQVDSFCAFGVLQLPSGWPPTQRINAQPHYDWEGNVRTVLRDLAPSMAAPDEAPEEVGKRYIAAVLTNVLRRVPYPLRALKNLGSICPF